MPFDEIDDALRRQPAWDPPEDFSLRVAALAVAAQPDATRPTALRTIRDAVAGIVPNCSARVSGYAWMVRQYWALLAR